MLLALDIGNSETTVGLFQGDDLIGHWRLTTNVARTPDEWSALLSLYLVNAGHSPSGVRAAVLASVAPLVTQSLVEGLRGATGVAPTAIDARSALPIVLDVDEPLTVGADRIVNTLAAARLFAHDTIVVDFGTATTFDCITKEGRFLGGVIMPGIRTASDELVRRTAKLPATELTPPARVIGKRTEDCIRAGVLWGTADAVDGLVRRIRDEWPGGGQRGAPPRVVATGGLASLVASLCREIESVHPDLTLVGLRLAARALGLGW
jgi:type III pantothenate kinase